MSWTSAEASSSPVIARARAPRPDTPPLSVELERPDTPRLSVEHEKSELLKENEVFSSLKDIVSNEPQCERLKIKDEAMLGGSKSSTHFMMRTSTTRQLERYDRVSMIRPLIFNSKPCEPFHEFKTAFS